MEELTNRNRLGDAPSPYLRQHADNPVHWQPWDETALTAAVDRDEPIFLSIGYAACHWCHVMAEESFEDDEVASILNEHFIPIKVDREEHPDVDSIYMTACRLVRGGGGWPLSVWLTPDRKPFRVATYLPRDSRPGQPGFVSVLEDIVDAWNDPERRDGLEERANQLTNAIVNDLETVPDTGDRPDVELVEDAVHAAIRSADRNHGGFGDAPKFPQPRRIRLLFRGATRFDVDDALAVGTDALDAMANGGLFDHVSGGFHRYCTDQDWTVPHYEKMLYDNAELPLAYLDGFRITGDHSYATVVEQTLTFLETELQHPDGGFYATLSARSGDSEGAYYTWTPRTIQDAIAASEASDPVFLSSLATDRWGVTPDGNTDTGRTVLTVSTSISDLADAYDLTPQAIESHLETARTALATARDDREQPPRDEKILAGWNGLAIAAFAEAGFTLDTDYLETAGDALSFVRSQHWDGDRLYHRFHHGTVGIPGYLEDYAFLARGALTHYEVTGDHQSLRFALELCDALIDRFWDSQAETLYFTGTGDDSLVARPQELQDQSTPSSTGIAVQVLTTMAQIFTDVDYGEIAAAILETHGSTLRDHPLAHVSLVSAADTIQHGVVEITGVGPIPEPWKDTISRTYLPDRLITYRPVDAASLDELVSSLGLSEVPSVWADRDAVDGHSTAYVCRRACSPPLQDRDALVDWLQELR